MPSNDTQNQFTGVIDQSLYHRFTKTAEQAIGVSIEHERHRVYLKAFIRDGRPHYFLSVSDEFGDNASDVITLTRHEDGSFEQRYDLPF